ncbi:MAG: aminoacyl-histidine dipeptidase [Lachnospiraceae bacterium]
MASLEELEPQRVFYYFKEINSIPRGTFNCKQISDYLVGFAKKHEFEYIQDEYHNVIIKKPGSKGYETSEPVIIQGHMDMVCEKTEHSAHDFTKDPIEMYIEDGFLRAKETTLGADDGIAVAYALAVLESKDLNHPPLEVVITADEEVGMVGAEHIDISSLKGRMLINIDSDVEGTILSGCAGGFRQTIHIPLQRTKAEGTLVSLQIRGLQGGHSGIEIHQQRGNANKIMGRILTHLQTKVPYVLVDMNGGTKDNVITSINDASIIIKNGQEELLKKVVSELEHIILTEMQPDEPNFSVVISTKSNETANAFTMECTKKAIYFVTCTPNGVQGMSRALPGLVETSLNLGIVNSLEDGIEGMFLVRSSMESKKEELKEALATWAEILGGTGEISNSYPGWAFKSDSKLRPIVLDTYESYFGREPIVTMVHAGLECGLLCGQLKDLDCVSFGPNNYDIHSANEHLDIASTRRYWNYLLEVLKVCK